MFENITKRLGGVFAGLRGKRLTESNIRDGLREVRKALLEADVSYKVVKDFINRVTEKAVGEEVIRSVSPAQQIVKIVHDELVALMGPGDVSIPFAEEGPTVLMLCGLQGSGKTTTCGKLAVYLEKKYRKSSMLVAADVQRPAAVKQLQVIGSQLGVPVFSLQGVSPPEICRRAVAQAKRDGVDVLILDTAGRLHIDEPLMRELERIVELVSPHQLLFVCDAMTGQDAVNSAREFNARLPLDGVVLTKMDGDARGGAALSIRYVTGKPVKFMGVGEKFDAFEEFHPERVAGRILGMGDVVSLVEKAQEVITEEEARKMQERLLKNEMNLEDFLDQLRKLKKLGAVKDVMSMLPGVGSQLSEVDFDDAEFKRVEAVILSMTPDERRHPEIISSSRRLRIARGSGTDPRTVSQLLKQFGEMKKLMSKISKPTGFMGKLKGLVPGKRSLPPEMQEGALPPGFPPIAPGAEPPLPGAGHGRKKLSRKEKRALRKKQKKQRKKNRRK